MRLERKSADLGAPENRFRPTDRRGFLGAVADLRRQGLTAQDIASALNLTKVTVLQMLVGTFTEGNPAMTPPDPQSLAAGRRRKRARAALVLLRADTPPADIAELCALSPASVERIRAAEAERRGYAILDSAPAWIRVSSWLRPPPFGDRGARATADEYLYQLSESLDRGTRAMPQGKAAATASM